MTMSMTVNNFADVLRETMKKTKSLSSVELPENLVDLMYETIAQGGKVPLVSVRDLQQSAIPLPFMPDRIDYKIGKGCCDEIVKCDGLFVPCSKQCDGDKCAKHLKAPTGFGNYWDRHAAWSKHELYCVIIPEKEVKGAIVKEKELKEKTYGTYLHSKKLDSAQVAEELSKWGVSLQLDPSLFRAPAKPLKKSRGRKAEKKVASTESDEESEESEKSESDDAEESQKSEGEISEDEEEKPKEIKKKVKEPKVKAVKEPKEPKVKAVKEPKVPKEPKAPKVKAPKVKEPEPEPEPEPEAESESEDEMTLGDLVAKAKALGLDDSDDEDEPIVVEDELEAPSDDEPAEEPESDDEDLSMLSKKPEIKPEVKPEPKPEVKEKKEKPKPVRARSSSPGELKKEKMEKAPKKGAVYKGKKESMSEVVYDDDTYLFKDGRYYNPESLELLAWDNKGEFELL